MLSSNIKNKLQLYWGIWHKSMLQEWRLRKNLNKSSETGENKEKGNYFYGISFHNENTINTSTCDSFENCVSDPGNLP